MLPKLTAPYCPRNNLTTLFLYLRVRSNVAGFGITGLNIKILFYLSKSIYVSSLFQISYSKMCDLFWIKNVFSSLQTCQRDIKNLRERELTLQGELSASSKEINRLRDLLKEYTGCEDSTAWGMARHLNWWNKWIMNTMWLVILKNSKDIYHAFDYLRHLFREESMHE